MATHPSLVLLNRHLSLKEPLPFTLIVDSLTQTAAPLISEYVYRSTAPVVYLSFETVSAPSYATAFYECGGKLVEDVQAFVASVARGKKALVVVDSLNYVAVENLSGFVSALVLPHHALVGCFHTGAPGPACTTGPAPLTLLHFIAHATFEVEPLLLGDEAENLEHAVAQFRFPSGLNSTAFKVLLTHKKKSGKSLAYAFTIDLETHLYDIHRPEKDEPDAEDVMEGLTTFNLSMSSKQKLAREQVELPFMEAQTELGKYGGAIVYEFEKDDDYDEEDPYEDPF